jgi:hypothetical protein
MHCDTDGSDRANDSHITPVRREPRYQMSFKLN